jgi:hypothetical protein
MANADLLTMKAPGEILDIIATPTNGRITPEVNTGEMLISEESYDSLPPGLWPANTGLTIL